MNGVRLEELRGGPGEMEPTRFVDHRLALQLNGPVRFEALRDGRYRPVVKEAGRFAVTPAGATVGLRCLDETHFLLVSLDPAVVAGVVAAEPGARPATLVERHGCDDPHAAHLLRALRDDHAAGHPSGPLYTETLVRALVLRLAAVYVEPGGAAIEPAAVRRVRDYIESDLAANPSLADLAAVAGLSPYHFARTFKRATGLPPHRYLIARRLERAKGLLAGSGRPIVDIALDLGFATQGHFQRAFRRHVGATPGAFRRGS